MSEITPNDLSGIYKEIADIIGVETLYCCTIVFRVNR